MDAQTALGAVMRRCFEQQSERLQLKASFPLNDKLAVLDAILEPTEKHVTGFGAFLFCSSIEDAAGDTVVSGDDSDRLEPSHFMDSGQEWDSLGCIFLQGVPSCREEENPMFWEFPFSCSFSSFSCSF